MSEKKKEEKKPLDMTTDEAMEYLLGTEGARKLKEETRKAFPPPEEKNRSAPAKSSRKHSSR